MIIISISFGFGLLARQKKQFEDVNLDFGKLWWAFYFILFLLFFDISTKWLMD